MMGATLHSSAPACSCSRASRRISISIEFFSWTLWPVSTYNLSRASTHQSSVIERYQGGSPHSQYLIDPETNHLLSSLRFSPVSTKLFSFVTQFQIIEVCFLMIMCEQKCMIVCGWFKMILLFRCTGKNNHSCNSVKNI